MIPLSTGCLREQECEYACWPDVDFEGKTYSIQEHLDLGFVPKDSEEGTIRISNALVEILRARRKRYPVGRLIFPGPNGKPCRTFSSWLVENCASADQESPCGPGRQPPGWLD